MEYGPDYPIPVVTSDDVRVIARYVSTGKLLPLTAEGVKKEIPNAPDTLVTEVMSNYKIIKEHADSWEKTQESMVRIANVLVYFSKDLHQYGDDAVVIIRNMEGYRKRKIGDLTVDELNAFPSIALDGDDERQIATLEQTVKYIKESIDEKKRKSLVALADLDSFKSKLINIIQPWIGKMIQISNPDALDMEISNILSELKKHGDNVKQAHVKSSFMQDIMGFASTVALLKTALEQSKAPGQTDGDLIKRREEILNKLSTDKNLKGVFYTLHIGMGSLFDVVNPAITATMQLHSHWENILLLIDDSLNQFKTNANYALLGLFVVKLEKLLRDWRNIEDNSDALMRAFRLDI